MSKVKFAKVILPSVVLAVLMFSSVLSAFAVCEADFMLSDAQGQKGRLFEVTLSAKGDVKLSAFVAELVFDSRVMSFSSASVSGNDAQYSINTNEQGKLCAVYLCEEGVLCTKDTVLMTFTFKALTQCETQIALSVRDAVASDLTEISVSECVPSKVTVKGAGISSTKNSKDKTVFQGIADAENTASADERKSSFINGRTDIGGLSVSNQTLVSLALSFVCTLCVAVYVAYKLGKRQQKNSQKSVPLEYKETDIDSK